MSGNRIIRRAEWRARAPKRRLEIPTPTPELWLHHSVTGASGDLAAIVRQIQAYHMDSKGWSDIAYSFLVGPDGSIYEGRGAGVAGGHTEGHNKISHAICAIGNYDSLWPPTAMLDAIAWLVAHGHAQGWWPAQITGGHRQASGASTACPGRHLMTALPDINAKALAGTNPTPPTTIDPPKGPLMALTDKEQDELLAKVRDLHTETGVIAGFVAAVLEAADSAKAVFFNTGAKRLADRAGHLNPYRKK